MKPKSKSHHSVGVSDTKRNNVIINAQSEYKITEALSFISSPFNQAPFEIENLSFLKRVDLNFKYPKKKLRKLSY